MKIQIADPIINQIAQIAHINNVEIYLVGGYVRDMLLNRKSKDIDIVVIGNGPNFAEIVGKMLNVKNISIFKNYGTAHLTYKNYEIEIVGARKESYSINSRKPQVEPGTLEDDLLRRDFTINALAVSLKNDNYGEIIDYFNGVEDLKNKIIRTPTNADITFSDDPLRMLRAIRFASQLNFHIDNQTFNGIKRNVERIKIVSSERIVEELNKILLSDKPSIGLLLLFKSGLLKIILPEVDVLHGVEVQEGISHKDNFYHTIKVVDNLRAKSDKLWLLWAGLLHDIGKYPTKQFTEEKKWSFHGHEVQGAILVEKIFRRLKMPLHDKLNYVKKLVLLHLRPISLVCDEITDSAIRRLIYDAGDDIEDLLLLAESDITTKNEVKMNTYLNNLKKLREKIKEVELKDKIRNFQPPVRGDEIMKWFKLPPCKIVGELKDSIKNAILDGVISNDRNSAIEYLKKIAKEKGLEFHEVPL
ncbi:MAG: CCA tRNA nucleotidyltransferase [Bacteroidales bacterium]|nr:CCA tRNA nucleotidyltransferase [Bacteroidales bacterium]